MNPRSSNCDAGKLVDHTLLLEMSAQIIESSTQMRITQAVSAIRLSRITRDDYCENIFHELELEMSAIFILLIWMYLFRNSTS